MDPLKKVGVSGKFVTTGKNEREADREVERRAEQRQIAYDYREATEKVVTARHDLIHARLHYKQHRQTMRWLRALLILCTFMLITATTLAAISGWVPNLGAAITALYVSGGSAVLPTSVALLATRHRDTLSVNVLRGGKQVNVASTSESRLESAKLRYERALAEFGQTPIPDGVSPPLFDVLI